MSIAAPRRGADRPGERFGSGDTFIPAPQVAKAKGRLRGKQPKLTARQEQHLVALHQAGRRTGGELAELFGVARSTVYRANERSARLSIEPSA